MFKREIKINDALLKKIFLIVRTLNKVKQLYSNQNDSNFQQVNLTPGSIFQKFKVVYVRQVIQITSLFSTLKKVFLTAYNLIQ